MGEEVEDQEEGRGEIVREMVGVEGGGRERDQPGLMVQIQH